jgi:hypothetical protein
MAARPGAGGRGLLSTPGPHTGACFAMFLPLYLSFYLFTTWFQINETLLLLG